MISKKSTFTVALIQLLFLSVYCQKLPNVQLKTIHASPKVKIDGNPNEWPDFQAYNNKTNVYYTLANDSNNIYLVIKSDNKLITSKILQGGLKFIIKKKDGKDIVVTYPIVDNNLVKLVYKLMPKATPDNLKKEEENEALIKWNLALNASNKEIVKLFKVIGIVGLKNVQESEISIYNNLNIKVSSSFDALGAYICEFALPLKYVTDSPNDLKSLQYSVRLLAKKIPNGVQIMPVTTQDGGAPLGEGGIDLRSFGSDTFFWAEYQLSK